MEQNTLHEILSREFSQKPSAPPKAKDYPGSSVAEFLLGEHLAHPISSISEISQGDTEALKGLLTDIALIAAPYAAGRVLSPLMRPLAKLWRPVGEKIWEKAFLGPWKRIELTKVGKFLTPPETIIEHHTPKALPAFERYARVVSRGREFGTEAMERLAKLGVEDRLAVIRALQGKAREEELSEGARSFLKFLKGTLPSQLETKPEEAILGRTVLQEKLRLLSRRLAPFTEKGQKKLLEAIDKEAKRKLGVSVREAGIEALDALARDPEVPRGVRLASARLRDLHRAFRPLVAKSVREAQEASLFHEIARMPGVASKTSKPGFRMPKNPVWRKSKLLGKLYLKEDVAHAIDEIHQAKRYVKKGFGDVLQKLDEYFMVPWKLGKVVLNPPTHFRNIMTNVMLNDIGGLPFYRTDIYARALREMLKGSERYKLFARLAGYPASWTRAELGEAIEKALTQAPKRGWDVLLKNYYKLAKPLLKAYGAEEVWAKYAKFLWNLEKQKLTPEEAVKDALKWTLDYRRVSPAIRYLRATVWPFATFPLKVAPVVLEATVKNPARVAKWLILPWWIQQVALEKFGPKTEQEWKQIKTVMPDYIRQGYMVLVPWRDSKGRLQLLDFTYILPLWADIAETTSHPMHQIIQNPLFSIAAAITHNKTFSGAPIYLETDPPHVKFLKVNSYIYQELTPAIFPGGRTFQKLYEALREEPRALTRGQAIAYMLGLRTQPVEPARWAAAHRIRAEEARRALLAEARRKLLKARTKKEAAEVSKWLTNRLQRLQKQYGLANR